MDPTFSVIDPRAKLLALEETAWVQREVDDGLRVMFDGERQKYVVLDTKAPGGPDASYVMLVQNEDGSYRPFDHRTIQTLRKLRREHHEDNLADLVAAEQQRQRDILSRRESAVSGFVDDFRNIGKQITPSVGWRDRSLAREAIRKAAH